MLVLHNFWGWYYQMWEKNMSTTKCGKSTIKCDVSTAQCDNGTNKCEKKNKGIIEWDKSTVIYDVGTTQFLRMVLSNVKRKYEYNRMWQKYGQMWC